METPDITSTNQTRDPLAPRTGLPWRPKLPSQSVKDIAVCPSCSALKKDGQWIWGSAPSDSRRQLCPACRQIREGKPAARILIRSDVILPRRQEIFALVRNIEAIETQRSPLQRIVTISQRQRSVSIDTTDEHIARRIALAICKMTGATLSTRQQRECMTMAVS